MIKRKQINLMVAGLLLILMIQNIPLNSAYETDSSTRLSLEQSTNNFELIGSQASTQDYAMYSNPAINNESVTHDATYVNITRVQQATFTNFPVNYSYRENTQNLTQYTTEYTCSAPFDTHTQLNVQYNTSSVAKNYSNDYSLSTGALSSGSLSDLQTEDANYMKFAPQSNLPSEYLSASACVKTGWHSYFGSLWYSYYKEGWAGGLYEMHGLAAHGDTVEYEFNVGSTEYHIAYLTFEVVTSTYHIDVKLLDAGRNVLSTTTYHDGQHDIELITTSNIKYILFETENAGVSADDNLNVDYLALKTVITYDLDLKFIFPVNTLLSETVYYGLRYKINTAGSSSEIDSCAMLVNNSAATYEYDVYHWKNGSSIVTQNTNSINFELNITATGTAQIYLYVEYFVLNSLYNQIKQITTRYQYEVTAISYIENITLTLHNQTGVFIAPYTGNSTVNAYYLFDSAGLTNYDHVNDLKIVGQILNFTLNITASVVLGINYTVGYSASVWIVPSVVGLYLNGIEVIDESYNSGYAISTTYPSSLNFTATASNIYFNFSLVSIFTYTTNLEMLSRSYLSKTLILTADHALTLTTVEYLFDSSIKHSYLNNVDYATAKTISPIYAWTPSSSLKIEVILGDDAYLPLEPINLLSNSSSLLSLFARSNVLLFSDIGTQSLNFAIPTGFNVEQAIIDVSNIQLIESYSPSENNTYNVYSETQTQNQAETVITNSSERFEYANLQNITSSINNYNVSVSPVAELGHYKGFYTYRYDTINPFSVLSEGGGTVVADSYQYHNKVLAQTASAEYNGLTETIDCGPSPTSGNQTVELYMAETQGTADMYGLIYLMDTIASKGMYFGFKDVSGVETMVFGTDAAEVTACGWIAPTEQWIRVKFEVDYTTRYIGVSVNGTWRNKVIMPATMNAIDSINLAAYYDTNVFYTDSISFSWATGYTIGDLQYEETLNATLNERIDLHLSTITEISNVKNMSIQYVFQTSTHTIVNSSIYNYYSNVNVSMLQNVSTDFSNTFIYNIANYSQVFINSSNFNVTLYFYATNASAFQFNLTQLNIFLNYYNGSVSEIAPNLVVTAHDFVYVGQSNNISIAAQHTINSLHTIRFWDNISNTDQDLGTIDGQYSVLITNTTSQYYSIGVFVNDTNGNWKMVNITNIFIAKNSSEFALTNLYQQYYQNQTVNVSTTLNRNVSLTIYYPNGALLQTSINRTIFSIAFNTTGWYRVNATYDNNTNAFLNFSVETVFEVLPLSRNIALSQSVNLVVNSQSIVDNSRTLYYLNNSFTLAFSADSVSTFDLSIYFLMNYTQTLSFSELSNANFTFTASSNISSIFTLNVSLSSYPTFLAFYYNGQASTNYVIWNNSLYLLDANATTFLNRDYFTLGFTISGDEYLQQITSPVLTTDTNVNFREYYQADRAFRNWYITSTYDINSITLTRTSTSTAMSLTYEDPNWYFQYLSAAGDLYSAIWGIDPNFDVEYTVIGQNSLNTTVDVRVKSDLYVENVTVVVLLPVFYDSWDHGAMSSDRYLRFDINYSTTTWQTIRCIGLNQSVQQSYSILSSNGTYCQIAYTASANFAQTNYTGTIDLLQYDIYQENWTASTSDLNNLTQSLYTKQISFIIPSFVGAYTCVYTGVSRVPYASVDRYISDLFMEISLDLYANYTAYLQYPQYSENFILNLSDAWVLDGVHYMNNSYDILPWGYFVCPGWGTSISSSYLKFSCNPIVDISRIDDGDYVYIYVNSTLPMENVTFQLELDIEESYKVICNYTTDPVNSKLVYISQIMIEPGMNVLVFYIQRVSLAQSLSYLFIIIAIAIGLTGYYLYNRYNASNEPFWSFRWITKKTKQASKAKTPADRKPDQSNNKSSGGPER